MNIILSLILFTYPHGFFGTGPASGSDAGMMIEHGIFALEYNPSGLGWIDTLEVGVASHGLFSYNLVGFSYKYLDWPVAASVHYSDTSLGFSLGGAYRVMEPLSLGAAFTTSFDTPDSSAALSVRLGTQWRQYAGVSVTPRLWLGQTWAGEDTASFNAVLQFGVSIPVIYDISILAGGLVEIPPRYFRIGAGVSYEPVKWFKAQTVATTEDWAAGLMLSTRADRGGIWVRKPYAEDTPWYIGLSYVRVVDFSYSAPDTIYRYRNLPARVDTVFVPEANTTTTTTTTHTVSPEIRKRQEQLMARANQLYTAQRYEEAIAVWNEVIALDPYSDLAARARQDIADVQALLETLERIRTGRGGN